VPRERLELSWIAPGDFESPVSTISPSRHILLFGRSSRKVKRLYVKAM
jgi:hypothetical protein